MISKKFKSSAGVDVRLTLPTGEVAWVTNEWGALPPQFHSTAYASECISDDMVANTVEQRVDPNIMKTLTSVANKRERWSGLIQKWLAENDETKFHRQGNSKDYKPKVLELTKVSGMQCSKNERDSIWYKLLDDGIELPEFS